MPFVGFPFFGVPYLRGVKDAVFNGFLKLGDKILALLSVKEVLEFHSVLLEYAVHHVLDFTVNIFHLVSRKDSIVGKSFVFMAFITLLHFAEEFVQSLFRASTFLLLLFITVGI